MESEKSTVSHDFRDLADEQGNASGCRNVDVLIPPSEASVCLYVGIGTIARLVYWYALKNRMSYEKVLDAVLQHIRA